MRKHALYLLIFFLGIIAGGSCGLLANHIDQQIRQEKKIAMENVQSFAPPDSYKVWFSEVEACSGLSAPYDSIVWETASSLTRNDSTFAGVFTPPYTITLHNWVKTGRVTVKHEMLHYLLRPRRGHPSPPFKVCNK